MNGRIIPTILGKGHDFQKLGHHPLFWPFMVHLGTTMAPMGVSFIQYVKMSTYWGLRSNESQLVHHLGPRWFSCTLYISTPSVNDEEFNSKNTCLILGWRKSSFGPTHYICLVLASFLNANEILGLNLSKQRYKQRSLSFLVCQMSTVSVYVRESCLISGDFPLLLNPTSSQTLWEKNAHSSYKDCFSTGVNSKWRASNLTPSGKTWTKNQSMNDFCFSQLLPSKLTNTWPAPIATPCKSLTESVFMTKI